MNTGPVSQDLPPTPLTVGGVRVYPGWLSPTAQAAMVEDLRTAVAAAPFVTPVTPGGRRMSVRMTAAGRVGWITDRRGYRYAPRHPGGGSWPPIPDSVRAIWDALAGTATDPDTCLINHYAGKARMGLHQDRDEGDFSFPVVSVSLGDSALFRIGGTTRAERTQSVWLHSGDVVVLGGAARLAYHGIDRVRAGSSALLRGGGRLNLTLRVVRPAVGQDPPR